MGWIVFGGGVVLGLAMGVLVMVWALCKVATVVPLAAASGAGRA